MVAPPEIRRIRGRLKKNRLREVFFYKNMLAKRFVQISRRADSRRVWEWEDAALKRLEGLGFPSSFGFVEKRFRGAKEVIFAREFIPGEPLSHFRESDMGELGALMARIHQRGVIVCDPAPDNFIRKPDGRLLFIDFGRAKVITGGKGGLLFYMGKDLARVRHHSLLNDPERFARFYAAYSDLTGLSRHNQRLVYLVCRLWTGIWTLRQRRRALKR